MRACVCATPLAHASMHMRPCLAPHIHPTHPPTHPTLALQMVKHSKLYKSAVKLATVLRGVKVNRNPMKVSTAGSVMWWWRGVYDCVCARACAHAWVHRHAPILGHGTLLG